jgi:Lon protease-like protein
VQNLPLFPLNTVVFPGAVTPLHVFEDRYRKLVRDLLAIADPGERVFGVVAIREGYEVGDHGMQSVHRVGTLVQLTEAEEYADGRFDIETTARQRMVVTETDSSGSYLRCDVELLDDPDEPGAEEEVTRTLQVFEDYRHLLSGLRGGPVLDGAVPSDPAYLSYTLAASCPLTLPQRQALLQAETARERLGMLRRTLTEEIRAMQAIPSLPATEVARTRWSPN